MIAIKEEYVDIWDKECAKDANERIKQEVLKEKFVNPEAE